MEELAAQFDFKLIGMSVLIVVAGMVSHWLKKYTLSDATMTFSKYFFRVKGKHTLGALMAAIGAAVSAVMTNTIDPNLTSGVMTLYLLGYTADSALNSDGKPKINATGYHS